MSKELAELRVELELGESPISGHLTDPRGERIAFAGWAQLVALIDRVAGELAGLAIAPGVAPPTQPQRRSP